MNSQKIKFKKKESKNLNKINFLLLFLIIFTIGTINVVPEGWEYN